MSEYEYDAFAMFIITKENSIDILDTWLTKPVCNVTCMSFQYILYTLQILENTTLQEQLLQRIQSSEQRILREQNETLQEIVNLLSQNIVQQFQNGSFQNPVPSCKYIQQGSPSGNYWVQRLTTGYATQAYCDMTSRCASTGGWMRVADFNMTHPSQNCPQGFRTITSPRRLCGRQRGPGCASTTFPVHGVSYQKVCGRIIAYQYYQTDAFAPYHFNRAVTIDGTYIDGVSITHGHHPRKHVWSFASTLDETRANYDVCPCTKTDVAFTGVVPPFVGQDYFCDTGSRYHYQDRIYSHDPLWDGSGCGSTSTCCRFNSPPWFCKQLSQPTTDDIELRLCSDESANVEDALIELVELYVQ